ncbi:MAG TPA: peptidylprolyl isomerase, partial [Kofleriaceae bacterium]|nr:peptidylprolyl isomerase [Kofleriaceae bacterium]
SVAIDEGARRALAGSAGHVDALVRLARDADPEVRAPAVMALGKREAVAPSLLVAALADGDWRVRVEAVRALAQPRLAAEQRAALAAHLAREWALAITEGMRTPRMHVVLEGLSALAGAGGEKLVAEMAAGLEKSAAGRLARTGDSAQALAAGAVHCLAVAIRVRAGGEIEDLLACGGPPERGWPAHLRRALAAETAAAAGAALPADNPRRRHLETQVQTLTMDGDPRVRAAALSAAVELAKGAADLEPLERRLRAGIGDRSIEVSGTAADAVAELATGGEGASPEAAEAARRRWAPLVDLVGERAAAGVDGDIEVRLTYLGALAKARAGREVCVLAHGDPAAPVRRAARDCLKAIDGVDSGPGTARAAAPPPPYRPDGNQAKVRWQLSTSKGLIEIDLDPQRAPWHVAAIIGLTRSGLYDGRLWHRVAAGFVVQGGSPYDSSWGGPDFILPGEPTPGEYRHGTVGIADSGMDTGGSQFFIMHGRAPHLDGRYTIVGEVVTGQSVADALIVGDTILHASVIE